MVTINSEAVRAGPIVADSESTPGPTLDDYNNAIQLNDVTIPVHSYILGTSGDNVIRLNPDYLVVVPDWPSPKELQKAAIFWDAIQRSRIEIVPATLAIAEQELAGVAEDAQEEGYPAPSDLAFENARRLLPAICQLTPHPVAVYADPDDGIAIDISGGFGRSVLLLCESDGGTLLMVNLDGEHRRARYDNTHTLPDGFIREALAEMESKPRE